MSTAPEVWYRYEDYLVSAGVDEFDNPLGPPTVKVQLCKLNVLRHTPKGVWLNAFGKRRLVLVTARKRYACPTVEEARASFIARKQVQIKILQAKLRGARRAIEVVSDNLL